MIRSPSRAVNPDLRLYELTVRSRSSLRPWKPSTPVPAKQAARRYGQDAGRCTPPTSAGVVMPRPGRWCRACWRRCSSSSASISLALVLRYLATGEGLAVAAASVVVKTLLLYAIMVTGSIWEKRRLRPLALRTGLLLGGRGLACWCWRCTPPISWPADRRAGRAPRRSLLALAAYATYVDQRRAVPDEAACCAARSATPSGERLGVAA